MRYVIKDTDYSLVGREAARVVQGTADLIVSDRGGRLGCFVGVLLISCREYDTDAQERTATVPVMPHQLRADSNAPRTFPESSIAPCPARAEKNLTSYFDWLSFAATRFA